MLRPATPLAILLFIAFVLLLLSVISTPIVKGIPLASFDGIDYGVFGFCQGSQCSGVKVGYTTSDSTSFSLSTSTRHSLSTILVVHPVAAFLTLVCLILALTAHLHSPSHSPRYLMALIILLLPTILVTLLAFLVDILLFVPHLSWGGWIVLASTILIVASGVVTCAMRRTLVSRKARKKRIAENAEMSGENFYNRQNGPKADSPPPLTQQPTAPMVNGAPGANKLPSFATFDSSKNRWPEDDQTPLNATTPTAPSTAGRSGLSEDGMDRYGQNRGGMGGMGGMGPGRGGRGGRMYDGPRDEFGNPLPPSAGYGPGPGMRRPSGDGRSQYSNDSAGSQGFRGRGRGGYAPRGYGRGGPYGGRGGPGMGGNGRGGIPLGAMAAGAGAGAMAGEMTGRGQRGPPPGYPRGGGPGQYGQGQYGQDQPSGAYGAPDSYGRRQSPGPPSAPGYGRNPSPGPPSNPGYGRNPSPGPPSAPGYAYGARGPSPGSQNGLPFRQNSPPPGLPLAHPDDVPAIGQAVEMNAATGSPSHTPGFPPGHPLRESDADLQGMIGLQQNRTDPTYTTSNTDSYVPARAEWAGGLGRTGTPPLDGRNPTLPQISTVPVELATQHTPQTATHSPQRARVNSGDNYYEDMDPRFSTNEPVNSTHSSGAIPPLLMPGRIGDSPSPSQPQQGQYAPPARQRLEPTSSYDSVQEGPASDASNFTSISQRGVNPEWRPEQPQGYGVGGVPNRRPMPQQQQQRDILPSGNPNFEAGGRGGQAGRGGAMF